MPIREKPITLAEIRRTLARTPSWLHDVVDALPPEAAISRQKESSPFGIVSQMRAVEDDWMRYVDAFFSRSPDGSAAPWPRPRPPVGRSPRTLTVAVDDFVRKRDRNLRLLAGLDLHSTDLLRIRADAEFRVVSIRSVLTTWARHDFVSLARIAQLLLRQYGRQPERWSHYFSLLAGFEAGATNLMCAVRPRT